MIFFGNEDKSNHLAGGKKGDILKGGNQPDLLIGDGDPTWTWVNFSDDSLLTTSPNSLFTNLMSATDDAIKAELKKINAKKDPLSTGDGKDHLIGLQGKLRALGKKNF